jgi:hypothetical protein
VKKYFIFILFLAFLNSNNLFSDNYITIKKPKIEKDMMLILKSLAENIILIVELDLKTKTEKRVVYNFTYYSQNDTSIISEGSASIHNDVNKIFFLINTLTNFDSDLNNFLFEEQFYLITNTGGGSKSKAISKYDESDKIQQLFFSSNSIKSQYEISTMKQGEMKDVFILYSPSNEKTKTNIDYLKNIEERKNLTEYFIFSIQVNDVIDEK